MKKTIIIYCLLFLGLSACNDLLDTKPSDYIASEYYFNTEADLSYALSGVYDILGNGILYGGGDGLITVFNTTDEMFHSSAGQIDRPQVYNYSAADIWPINLWQALYRGIERANNLLANVDKPTIDEKKRNEIKGETKFLRAYYYFVLVQNFGAVPLRIQPTASVSDIFYARTPAKDIYDFVYKEMVESEGLVQPITDFTHGGRVTKSAVQGILARVSLYMAGSPNNNVAKFNDALTWSRKVIDSGTHLLNPDYPQVFINLIQNKYDIKESIWELEFYTTGATDAYGETGSLGNSLGISQNLTEYGFSAAQYKVHEKFFRLFESTDTRRDWSIAPYAYVNNNAPAKTNWSAAQIYDRSVGKYRREYELISDKIKNNTGTNFPLLRYADVLLMAAEAENEVNGPTGKAYQYLNQVRARAKASSFTIGATKDSFRKLIQDERARELCFEGWRKLDLIRWGIFLPTMKALADYVSQTAPDSYKFAARAGQNATEKHYYIPIPQRELSLNKLLTQNTGW